MSGFKVGQIVIPLSYIIKEEGVSYEGAANNRTCTVISKKNSSNADGLEMGKYIDTVLIRDNVTGHKTCWPANSLVKVPNPNKTIAPTYKELVKFVFSYMEDQDKKFPCDCEVCKKGTDLKVRLEQAIGEESVVF